LSVGIGEVAPMCGLVGRAFGPKREVMHPQIVLHSLVEFGWRRRYLLVSCGKLRLPAKPRIALTNPPMRLLQPSRSSRCSSRYCSFNLRLPSRLILVPIR
jgi:hypothetical protein